MRNLSKIFICTFAVAVALLSCSKEQADAPFMLFEVHGKVMDVDGNPLEGINVISGQADVQTTNHNGDFVFYGRSVPSSHVLLTFEDKDGDKNGGDFVNQTVEISLNQKTPGTSGNYKGTFFAGDVEVFMVGRQLEMDTDSLLNLSGIQGLMR